MSGEGYRRLLEQPTVVAAGASRGCGGVKGSGVVVGERAVLGTFSLAAAGRAGKG